MACIEDKLDSRITRRKFLGDMALDIAIVGGIIVASSLPSLPEAEAKGIIPNSISGNKLTIYYGTNSWTLVNSDINDIIRFIKQNPTATNWTVEGYFDPRGDVESNLALGQSRAEGVKTYMKRNEAKGAIQIVSYGDLLAAEKTAEAYARKRRVVVNAGESTIKRGLDLIPGDAYFIDGSKSMNETIDGFAPNSTDPSRWQEVNNYHFLPSANIYVSSSDIKLTRIEIGSLRTVYPSGTANLWSGLNQLVEIEDHKTITVLTDGFDGMIPAKDYLQIAAQKAYNTAEKAKAKGIKLSFVQPKFPDSDFHQKINRMLIDTSVKTGGSFYIVNLLKEA